MTANPINKWALPTCNDFSVEIGSTDPASRRKIYPEKKTDNIAKSILNEQSGGTARRVNGLSISLPATPNFSDDSSTPKETGIDAYWLPSRPNTPLSFTWPDFYPQMSKRRSESPLTLSSLKKGTIELVHDKLWGSVEVMVEL